MRIAIPVSASLIAVVALVLSVVALADDGGSSGDLEPRLADLEGQQQETQSQLQEIQDSLTAVQLVAALDALDGTGIHHFDESTIQAGSLEDVPGGYLTDVRKIRRVVSGVSWPEDVQDQVQTILQEADEVEEALKGDDLAEMKAASPEFHAAWHALRDVGYQALSGEGLTEGEQHGGQQMDGMDGMNGMNGMDGQ